VTPAMAIAIFAGAAIIGLGIAAAGSAAGQGKAAASAMEAIARQPGAVNEIRANLILALAFMETLTLFVFAMVSILSAVVRALVR
jgi:F-type H+-transporting ATPase subunit c